MRIKGLVFIVLYFLFCSKLRTQTTPCIQFNTSNGLQASSVYEIIQLKDSSYILFTSEGMINYNGLNFTELKPINLNYKQSIIQGIALNDSIIFYHSFREGLYFYNLKTKTSSKEKFKWNNSTKELFSSGERRLHTLNNELFLCKIFNDFDKTVFNTLVYNIKLDKFKVIENTSDFKVYKSTPYYLSKNVLYSYSENGSKAVFNFNLYNKTKANAFCMDKNSNVYLTSEKKILKISNSKIIDEIILPEIAGEEIIEIEIDDFYNIWFITNNYHFYKYKNKQLTLVEDGTLKHPFIFIDKNQNLCMTSYTDGLTIYYNTFIRNFSKNEGIKNKSINKIKIIDGKVFICTNNGFYLSDNNHISNKTFESADIPFVYDVVKQNGYTLIATSGKASSQTVEKNMLVVPRRALYSMRNGWQLHSGWNNYIYINKNFNKDDPFPINDIESIVLPDTFPKNNFVIGFLQYNDSMVYVNTSVGLFDVNILNKSFSLVSQLQGKVNNIYYNIYANEYAYCTDFGVHIKPGNKNWSSLKKIILPKAKKVSCGSGDMKGRWWFGTNNGLYTINGKNIKKLTTDFGLLSNEISALCFDSVKNEMYIGTNNGFSIIDIEQFDKSNLEPPFITIKCVVTGNDTITNFNNYTFSPNQNSIEIRLGKIIMPNIKALKIRYALDGIWTETQYAGNLQFTSLSSDDHTFEIQSTIDGINWSKPTKIAFTIARPFYKSVVFYISVLLLLLTLTIIIAKKIIDKNKKENEKKLQLQTENTRLKFQALNASINPHFIFNALYSIQNFVYNNKGNIASNYLGKLSRLIRITLEQADNIEITLKEEIEKLEFYIQLEKMRFDDRISISFTNHIKSNPDCIKIPNMIVQPLIENAIIHGLNNRPTNGEISITFSEDITNLIIQIEDNGIGINRSQTQKKPNHKSIGLKNVKGRLALINGATIVLKDKSDLPDTTGTGTIIEIVIPKKHSTRY